MCELLPLAFLGIDFGIPSLSDLGQDIVDALFKFLEQFLVYVEELATDKFGLEMDVDELESQFDFAKQQAAGVNTMFPIFQGLSLVFGGVVAQWIIIFLRYLLGYFVGG